MNRLHAWAWTTTLTCLTSAVPSAQGAGPDDNKIVAEATGGVLKSTKGQYLDKDFNATVDYDAEVIDLNGDGQPEVFTRQYGGMFGGAGVALNLYIKGKNGQWAAQFGFPGDYKILKTQSQGYPDIEIQGPGTCFPVWRWKGGAYDIHKKCAR